MDESFPWDEFFIDDSEEDVNQLRKNWSFYGLDLDKYGEKIESDEEEECGGGGGGEANGEGNVKKKQNEEGSRENENRNPGQQQQRLRRHCLKPKDGGMIDITDIVRERENRKDITLDLPRTDEGQRALILAQTKSEQIKRQLTPEKQAQDTKHFDERRMTTMLDELTETLNVRAAYMREEKGETFDVERLYDDDDGKCHNHSDCGGGGVGSGDEKKPHIKSTSLSIELRRGGEVIHKSEITKKKKNGEEKASFCKEEYDKFIEMARKSGAVDDAKKPTDPGNATGLISATNDERDTTSPVSGKTAKSVNLSTTDTEAGASAPAEIVRKDPGTSSTELMKVSSSRGSSVVEADSNVASTGAVRRKQTPSFSGSATTKTSSSSSSSSSSSLSSSSSSRAKSPRAGWESERSKVDSAARASAGVSHIVVSPSSSSSMQIVPYSSASTSGSSRTKSSRRESSEAVRVNSHQGKRGDNSVVRVTDLNRYASSSSSFRSDPAVREKQKLTPSSPHGGGGKSRHKAKSPKKQSRMEKAKLKVASRMSSAANSEVGSHMSPIPNAEVASRMSCIPNENYVDPYASHPTLQHLIADKPNVKVMNLSEVFREKGLDRNELFNDSQAERQHVRDPGRLTQAQQLADIVTNSTTVTVYRPHRSDDGVTTIEEEDAIDAEAIASFVKMVVSGAANPEDGDGMDSVTGDTKSKSTSSTARASADVSHIVVSPSSSSKSSMASTSTRKRSSPAAPAASASTSRNKSFTAGNSSSTRTKSSSSSSSSTSSSSSSTSSSSLVKRSTAPTAISSTSNSSSVSTISTSTQALTCPTSATTHASLPTGSSSVSDAVLSTIPSPVVACDSALVAPSTPVVACDNALVVPSINEQSPAVPLDDLADERIILESTTRNVAASPATIAFNSAVKTDATADVFTASTSVATNDAAAATAVSRVISEVSSGAGPKSVDKQRLERGLDGSNDDKAGGGSNLNHEKNGDQGDALATLLAAIIDISNSMVSDASAAATANASTAATADAFSAIPVDTSSAATADASTGASCADNVKGTTAAATDTSADVSSTATVEAVTTTYAADSTIANTSGGDALRANMAPLSIPINFSRESASSSECRTADTRANSSPSNAETRGRKNGVLTEDVMIGLKSNDEDEELGTGNGRKEGRPSSGKRVTIAGVEGRRMSGEKEGRMREGPMSKKHCVIADEDGWAAGEEEKSGAVEDEESDEDGDIVGNGDTVDDNHDDKDDLRHRSGSFRSRDKETCGCMALGEEMLW